MSTNTVTKEIVAVTKATKTATSVATKTPVYATTVTASGQPGYVESLRGDENTQRLCCEFMLTHHSKAYKSMPVRYDHKWTTPT